MWGLPAPGTSVFTERFAEQLSFSICLPKAMLHQCIAARLFDERTANAVAHADCDARTGECRHGR